MQKLVFINGLGNEIDLTSGNFGITNWAGLSNTELNIQTQQVPFEDGAVFLDALMEQREIELTVAIYDGNNLELRYQKKRELISALNPKLGEGTLIYTNDYLSRQIKAVPQLPIFENKNSNDAGTLKASVAFTCPSPYWEDVEETSALVEGRSIIINEGDTDVNLSIELINSNSKNPTITNVTSDDLIRLDGTFDKNVFINTNLGQKSVNIENLNWQILGGQAIINKVAYSLDFNIYIGVGQGIIYLSKDGSKWESVKTEYNLSFNDVIAENGVIFIVGQFGIILKSTNGKDFILIDNNVEENLTSIIYSKDLDKYFISSSEGSFLGSEDGEIFTVVANGLNLKKIIYSTYYEKIIGVSERAVNTSVDGITWNTIEIQGSLVDIAINDNQGIINIACGGDYTYNSVDLINWTQVPSPIAYNVSRRIAYSEKANMFCVTSIVLQGQNDLIWYSQDGLSWKTARVQATGNIVYLKGVEYFLVYTNINEQSYSVDGYNWFYSVNNVTGSYNDILYSERKRLYIAVGQGIAISNDGIHWENKVVINYNSRLNAIAEGNNIFIAVGENSVYISEDGESWNLTTSINNLKDIFFRTQFVAVGTSGKVYQSIDGMNWEDKSISDGEDLYGVVIVQSTIYAGGENGILYYKSLISDSWNHITFNVRRINKIVSQQKINDTILYMVCNNGKIIQYVLNATQWGIQSIDVNIIDTGYSENILNIIISEQDKSFYACGQNGELFQSGNGINWKALPTGIYNDLTSLLVKDGVFILVGGIIEYGKYEKGENIISTITDNSSLNYKLKIGENNIIVSCESGNCVAILKYRQKYIGV